MKKFVTLMLALVLVLTAVSALASSPAQSTVSSTTVTSATKSTTTSSTTTAAAAKEEEDEPEAVISEFVDNSEETAALVEAFADALKAGDILSVFPADVKAQIPDGYATINEIRTYLLDNVPEGYTSLTINYVFDTKYAAGEKVIVAYGITSGKDTTWVLAEGTVQDNGSVNVTLGEDILSKIEGKKVTMVVISK